MRALLLCLSAVGLLGSASGCRSMGGYVMNQSGQTFYEQGNYAQAAQEFQRAVAADPSNSDYIANLAASMKNQGNLPGAERAWRHALYVNPTHQPSYHGLSQMLVESNRANDAAALLGTWVGSQPYSPEAQIEMAWLNRELGNEAGAAANLQQALQISPNNPKAQAALGQYYQDSGHVAEAITMYQQSLRNDWYQPQVQSRLSTLKGFAGPRVAQALRPMMRESVPDGGVANTAAIPFPPQPQFAQAAQLAREQNMTARLQSQAQVAQAQAAQNQMFQAQMAQAQPAPFQTNAAVGALPMSANPMMDARNYLAANVNSGIQQPHMANMQVQPNPLQASLPPLPPATPEFNAPPTFDTTAPVYTAPPIVNASPTSQYPLSGGSITQPYTPPNQVGSTWQSAPAIAPTPDGSFKSSATPPLNSGSQPIFNTPVPRTASEMPVPPTPNFNADPAHVPQISKSNDDIQAF